MFSKVALLTTFVAAAPQLEASQCNTGPVMCCNTVGDATSSNMASVLCAVLGGNIQGITGVVGLGCTPISVIGGGQGANCAQQPVCCSGAQFNGLVNIGCTPISL